ncbi:MAG: slipin family protein [Candidatus Sericytochromatia bacterium]
MTSSQFFNLIIIFSVFVIVLSINIKVFQNFLKRIVIFEYEKGLLYKDGKFIKILDSGKYWCSNYQTLNIYTGTFINSSYKHPYNNDNNGKIFIKKIDLRPVNITINSQELLSNDNISLKITLVTRFQIIDPFKAINNVQNFYEDLYIQSQIAIREIVGASKIDYILENRNEISSKLNEIVISKGDELGLKVHFISIKDIIFAGELKQIFAQVVKAQKEGVALLEKARGETAAIRNLVNASKVLDENPSLIYLRMLQALGESKGNTLVFGSDFEKLFNKKK